jgi:transcriptional regulator with XRE-family HTH domain
METLRDFLIKKNMTMKEFCIKNGFNYATFRQMMCGDFRPSPETALRISKATKGKVTTMELLYPKS